ncbi:MAG: glycosyltransferase family 2 protein [Lachnospiraceae bacterium]|nr:glycosyltransferase family 2 protein [Lachnospiraceae bacterium]
MGIKKIIKDSREKAARIYIKLFRRDLSSKGEKVSSNSFFADCVEKYDRELEDWIKPYGYWLRNDPWEVRAGSLRDEEGKITVGDHEYVLLITENTRPARGWKTAVRESLEEVIDSTFPVIIYGDEDVLSSGGNLSSVEASSQEVCERSDPFFKPDFSPELLEQFNYFGEMVLIRKDVLSSVCPDFSECDPVSPEKLYEIIRNAIKGLECKDDHETEQASRFPQALKSPQASEQKRMPAFDPNLITRHYYKSVLHIPHILSHRINGSAAEDCERAIERLNSTSKATSDPAVSVIIPTKDHPEVLRTCISSLTQKTDYDRSKIEIIVVDNGSSPAHKAEYEALSAEFDFKYIYDPQPFNYSHMNNLGAEKTAGELLLLLNDDTEIIESTWLRRMVHYAMDPEVGAVGAKLLYANTEKIQHAGVTNMAVGPSHKILALEDSINHYFGRNKLDYDMLAVTGACLMVSKDKFHEVGGLNEDLKVAYNDIDFCMKLFEHGYRSVQCNGAVLYHYESLTRGMDEGNEEKYHRLLAEKEKLYAAHTWAKGFDPFYNPNLIDNSSDYLPATKDCTQNTDSFSKLLAKGEPVLKDTFMVRARLDRVQLQLRNTEDAEDFIWLDGWGYVRGCDNRRFEKSLLLVSDVTRRYELFSTYRKDILGAFPGEDHIELSGFYFRLPVKELEGKTWQAVLVETDIITGKQLYKNLNRDITV